MFPKLLMKAKRTMIITNQLHLHLPTINCQLHHDHRHINHHHQDYSTTTLSIQNLIMNYQNHTLIIMCQYCQSQIQYYIERPLCMMFMNKLPRLKPNQKMIILNVLLFMTQLLFIEVTFQLNLKLKLMPAEVVSKVCVTQWTKISKIMTLKFLHVEEQSFRSLFYPSRLPCNTVTVAPPISTQLH